MKKNLGSIAGACFVTAIVAYSLLYALGVAADTRDVRDRGDTGRTIELTPPPPPPPAPSPAPSPAPPPPSGGITSETIGSVDTGGNAGGNVTTGDESVVVHEV